MHQMSLEVNVQAVPLNESQRNFQALLAALNESKGKILDDDSVISTLEKLKTEAAEVARKAAETDKVMAEVSYYYSFYLIYDE